MQYNKLTDAKLCKTIREKLGLAQKELGIKLGYSEKSANVSISRIESGNLKLTTPKWKLLLMYAGASVPDKKK